MDTTVWVSSWQLQCCGAEFRVGSTIRWSVKTKDDTLDWIDSLVGPTWADRIGHAEDHHLEESAGLLTGLVTQILVATRDRDRSSDSGPVGAMAPASADARLRRVDVADLWEPEHRAAAERRSFAGWLVQLTDARYERSDPTTR